MSSTLNNTDSKRALIIGSGLGGLECGRILASRGFSVIILERESQPGGCMQSYQRGSLRFDTGMHYVGGLAEGQPLHDAFSSLGLLHLPWVRLDSDGFDCITIGSKTYRMAEGYDNFIDTLAVDFPSEREALQRYVVMLKQSESRDPKVMKKLMETNAWEWLSGNFSDPLLINIISGASMKLELRKESLPLFTFLHINNSYIQSSWRLRGDGSLIASSLIDDIKGYGGKVVCNAEVVELIEYDGNIAEAVCKDGRRFKADVFISDIHPAMACELVHDSKRIRKVYRRRMDELTNTFGMFTVSLVLKPQTIRYFNYNNYVYSKPNVWDFYLDKGSVGGGMISCRVPDDAETDSEGRLLNGDNLWARQIDILTPMMWSDVEPWENTTIGRRGDDYKAMKRQRADECIALAEKVLPGLRSSVDKIYTSTPLTYRDYTLTPHGSAFGVRKDSTNALMTQLSPRTPIPNFLLTGQSIILHGLEGVTMTSLETINNII